MRGVWTGLTLLALATPLYAGVYNLDEPHPFIPVERTRETVLEVRSAAVDLKKTPSPESFRGKVLAQTAALEQMRRQDLLSTLDRVNLSGCYLRLGQTQQAIRLLLAGDPGHFLVQANLAAAYFLAGELDMALRHQQLALDRWPTLMAAWNAGQLQQYRECERLFLRLLQTRSLEARSRSTAPADLDALFPGLRFVNAAGEYAAGDLAPAMREKLPANALAVVLQLCLWFPGDMRLYWLLGEVLNALGQVDQAEPVLNDLVYLGYSRTFRDLHRHRRELADAARAARAWKEPRTRGQLLSVALTVPPPALGGAAAGAASHLAGTCVAAAAGSQVNLPLLPPIPGEGGSREVTVVLPFNWKHITVSFVFGLLVAVMLGFQWRLLRRRRPASR